MASIFDRQPLNWRQLVTVAERRFDDARALCETGKNKHANGAQYLGGFVVELLLKARLLQRFEKFGRGGRISGLLAEELTVWNLLNRSHDLTEILNRMPDIEAMVAKRGQRDGRPYQQSLRAICATLDDLRAVLASNDDYADAEEWLGRIRELKEVLK